MTDHEVMLLTVRSMLGGPPTPEEYRRVERQGMIVGAFLSAILITAILLFSFFAPLPAWADSVRAGAHVTGATTTVLVPAVAGERVFVYSLLICGASGATVSSVALQDTVGTNLVGASVTFKPAAGACVSFPIKANRDWYFNPTAAGAGVQVVTDAAGPVDVYVETVQR